VINQKWYYWSVWAVNCNILTSTFSVNASLAINRRFGLKKFKDSLGAPFFAES